MTASRRFFRDNIVLVATVALPAAVALLFVLATAVPSWTVPPPQHDLVLRAERPFASPPRPDVSVEFTVRAGRVEAIVRSLTRPADPNVGFVYPPQQVLLLFDHSTMQVREVSIELPETVPAGETRTVVVEELAGRQVVTGDAAPDGYRVERLSTGGGGIVGDLFGMNRRYRRGIAIGRSGRTIELELPTPYRDPYGPVVPIGWTRDGGR